MKKNDSLENSEYVLRFIEILNCRMELIQYIYPFELIEDDQVIEVHISRCKNIFKSIINHSIFNEFERSKKPLSLSEYKYLSKKMFKVLSEHIEPHISKYYENVVVKYINLNNGTLSK